MAGETGNRPEAREGFVLWLERGGAPDPPALRGTVERSATSQRTRFESGDGLLRILAAAMASPAEDAARLRTLTDQEKER